MNASDLNLRPHRLAIALLQPQIAPNTGNIARLCVATGTALHLVHPLGFVLSDRNLRRSAMDYWHKLHLMVHDDTEAFWGAMGERRCWLFSTRGQRGLWDTEFADGDCLVFGSETHGIADKILQANSNQTIRIPQVPAERCLNLSTAAGIGLFEALRRMSR